MYKDICSGWPAIQSGLKTLLETGEPMEWPETEDGRKDQSRYAAIACVSTNH